MSQNRQATFLKHSAVLKKTRKSFKTLFELKAQVHFQIEAWKWKLQLYQLELDPWFPYEKISNRKGQ